MTDILTRLAALTAKDENQLLPCHCGQRDSVEELYAGNPYQSEGNHPTDTFLYSVTCRRRCYQTEWHETPEVAINEWTTRPREAALIALVQEAAGEIERLESRLASFDEDKEQARGDGWRQGWHAAKESEDFHDANEN